MPTPSDDAARLAQMLKAIPQGLSLEQQERLIQDVRKRIGKARLNELCLARARLADWLLYYGEWIAANPDLARTSEPVQHALIRGGMIQDAIASYRTPTTIARIWQDQTQIREWMVSELSGCLRDWKNNSSVPKPSA